MIERILGVVSPQHNHYFTLIELLVVIAIMTILLGFLLPAFQKALESARAISCINQEKQLYHALSQYADDYKGWIPKGYDNDHPDSQYRYWAARLVATGHLLNYSKLVLCPTIRRDPDESRNIVYNGHVAGGFYDLRRTYRPSRLYLLMDTRGGYWVTVNYYPGYPHENKCNICFVDGHARTHPLGTVGKHTWSEPNRLPWYNRRGWNPDGPPPW